MARGFLLACLLNLGSAAFAQEVLPGRPRQDQDSSTVLGWFLDASDPYDLDRFGLNARLAGGKSGTHSSWNFYREHLLGRRIHDPKIGDANLTYCLLQADCIAMNFGLGCRWAKDRASTELGPRACLSADFFPMRPLHLSTSIDVGTLGGADVLHLNGTLGVVYQRWEVFSGYDFLSIGPLDLHGPLVGVRLRF